MRLFFVLRVNIVYPHHSNLLKNQIKKSDPEESLVPCVLSDVICYNPPHFDSAVPCSIPLCSFRCDLLQERVGFSGLKPAPFLVAQAKTALLQGIISEKIPETTRNLMDMRKISQTPGKTDLFFSYPKLRN